MQTLLESYFKAYDTHGCDTFAELSRFPNQFHSLMSGRALVGASLIAAALDADVNGFGNGAYVSIKSAQSGGILLKDEQPLMAPNLKMSSRALLSKSGVVQMTLMTSARFAESLPIEFSQRATWLTQPPHKLPLDIGKSKLLSEAYTGAYNISHIVPADLLRSLGDEFFSIIADLTMLMVGLRYELPESLSGYCNAQDYRGLCQRNPDAFYYASYLATLVVDSIARNSEYRQAA